MTITSDTIKSAFARIAKAKNDPAPEGVVVDTEKMLGSVVDSTTEFCKADDPLTKLDDLAKSVETVDTLLEGATENADGTILVKSEHAELAAQFAVEKSEEEDSDDDLEEEDDEEDESGDEEPVSKGVSDDDADLSDDISWENDLSPATPPVRRSEVLTKGERPVRAERGALTRMEKAQDKRDRALARRSQGRAGRALS